MDIFWSTLFVIAPVLLVLEWARRQSLRSEKAMDSSGFVLRLPRVFAWVGWIGAVFFGAAIVIVAVLATIFPDDTAGWWVYLILFPMFFGSLYFGLYCAYWELRVSGDELCHRTLLKQPRQFRLSDISKVEVKNPNSPVEQATLYAGTQKILEVGAICAGYYTFVEHLKAGQVKFE